MRFKQKKNGSYGRDYLAEIRDFWKRNWEEILSCINWFCLFALIIFVWFTLEGGFLLNEI